MLLRCTSRRLVAVLAFALFGGLFSPAALASTAYRFTAVSGTYSFLTRSLDCLDVARAWVDFLNAHSTYAGSGSPKGPPEALYYPAACGGAWAHPGDVYAVYYSNTRTGGTLLADSVTYFASYTTPEAAVDPATFAQYFVGTFLTTLLLYFSAWSIGMVLGSVRGRRV